MNQEYHNYSRDELIKLIHDLDKELFDLTSKVIELIDKVGWDIDGTYTFNTGECWTKFDPLELHKWQMNKMQQI